MQPVTTQSTVKASACRNARKKLAAVLTHVSWHSQSRGTLTPSCHTLHAAMTHYHNLVVATTTCSL